MTFALIGRGVRSDGLSVQSQPSQITARMELETARAETYGQLRGGQGTYQTSYVHAADTNAFSVTASNGRAAKVTGIEMLANEALIRYEVDGKVHEGRLSGQDALSLRNLDEKRQSLLSDLNGTAELYAADGVITPDEKSVFQKMLGEVLALQDQVAGLVDQKLGLSERLAGGLQSRPTPPDFMDGLTRGESLTPEQLASVTARQAVLSSPELVATVTSGNSLTPDEIAAARDKILSAQIEQIQANQPPRPGDPR